MATLTKGETLTIIETVADATAVELRYGGPKTGTASMTASGNEWTVNLDTASLNAGEYAAEVWATFTGNVKRIVTRHSFTIRAALAAGDIRSQARKSLEAIDAMLAGQAVEGVRRYKINNRELERYSVAELLQIRSHFAAEVQREERKNKGIAGLGPRIAVRF
ncbi:MAG: hypothetical protein LW645_06880 [Verrucomicrobiaceae bacterium]|jgi:hypothetical protein|nr:hypothetical protein [Verrucomicrobiaceae bacterium]